MSYNTRRGGGFGPNNSSASVGQRRPAFGGNQQGSNFAPSGSANSNATNRPANQTPAHQQPQQQQGGTQRQPQQQSPQQQAKQQPIIPRQQAPAQATVQQPQLQQQQRPPQQFVDQPPANTLQQPKVVFKTEAPSPIQPDKINTNGNEVEEAEEPTVPPRKKPFWMKSGVSKVSKRELFRRRNERLRRMLQPKNALMVLNELVSTTAYNVNESADSFDGSVFKCTVTVAGKEHVGVGKSKPAAKGAAAEAALKHLVLTRYKSGEFQNVATPVVSEGEEKMEVTTEETSSDGISWSHVASYALHKLLSEWDEGASLAEKLSSSNPASLVKTLPQEKKPAKKLPETAASMNPIMLLNQMHPNAVYDDVNMTGNPPHIRFEIKCTINEEEFHGIGPTKKAARKLCAFGACIKVLGIEYPQTFLDEHGVSFDGSGNVIYAQQTVADPAVQVA